MESLKIRDKKINIAEEEPVLEQPQPKAEPVAAQTETVQQPVQPIETVQQQEVVAEQNENKERQS